MQHPVLMKSSLGAVAALVAIAAIVLSAGSSGAQIPPTPTPFVFPTIVAPSAQPAPQLTAPPASISSGSISVCGQTTFYGALGGSTISDRTGALQVTLTEAGNYLYGDTVVQGQAALSICHLQTNSTIAISVATGRELGRSTRDGLAPTVLARILAGVVSYGGVAPVQAQTSTSGVSAFGASGQQQGASTTFAGIRPPSTGDAGLR